MPFRSRAQQRYLFAKHPKVAREFAAETPASVYRSLPDHAKPSDHLIRHMKKRHGREH